MKIDYWYGNCKRDIAKITILFYPESATYRGNLIDKTGRIIGDYATQNSVDLEKTFPGLVRFG